MARYVCRVLGAARIFGRHDQLTDLSAIPRFRPSAELRPCSRTMKGCALRRKFAPATLIEIMACSRCCAILAGKMIKRRRSSCRQAASGPKPAVDHLVTAQEKDQRFMKMLRIIAACLFSVGVALGLASTGSKAAVVGQLAPALPALGEIGSPNTLLQPVHYRRRYHCHTRWRRRCGYRYRRVCRRWRRGRCRRWGTRRVWRCYRAPRRYCHGGRWRRR